MYTYLRQMECVRANNETVVVNLLDRAVDVHFEMWATDEGPVVMVNMTEFKKLIDADDVSLSRDERDRLLFEIEEAARGSFPVA